MVHTDEPKRKDIVEYPGYYSGTKLDGSLILAPFLCKETNCEVILVWPIFGTVALIDLPLSLLADTGMLVKQIHYVEEHDLSHSEMFFEREVSHPTPGYQFIYNYKSEFKEFVSLTINESISVRPDIALEKHGFICSGPHHHVDSCIREVKEDKKLQTQYISFSWKEQTDEKKYVLDHYTVDLK